MDDLDLRNGLSDLPFPLVDQLTGAEHQGLVGSMACMGMDRGHGHDGFAGAHFPHQEKGFLSLKCLANRFNHVGLCLERFAEEAERWWQRITTGNVQRVQRLFGLPAQQRSVGEHVLVQVADVRIDRGFMLDATIGHFVPDGQVALLDSLAHQLVQQVALRQYDPGLAAALGQLHQDFPLLHLLPEPGGPFVQEWRRELITLEMLPQGLIAQDR